MRRTLSALAVGLSGALLAALVVIAVPAEGAPDGGGPGDPLLLSRVNQAGPMTVLKTNGGFRILAKNPKRPPLMIYTPDSMPPLDVSSTAHVANLNADLLDGVDSSAFIRANEITMPDAAYAGGEAGYPVGPAGAVVQSVTIDPPAPGVVLVTSSANAGEETAGDTVYCSITTGTAIDPGHLQAWESPGPNGSTAQLAGTRGFSVSGVVPLTVNLVCEHSGVSGMSGISDPALTALFVRAGAP
jgi:hypothetical protein